MSRVYIKGKSSLVIFSAVSCMKKKSNLAAVSV